MYICRRASLSLVARMKKLERLRFCQKRSKTQSLCKKEFNYSLLLSMGRPFVYQ